MNNVLFVLLLVFHTYSVFLDMREIKKYENVMITEMVRIKFYRECILYGWIPVGIILVFVALTPLSMYDIGIRRINMSNMVWLNTISLGVFLVIAIVLSYQTVKYLLSEEYRRQLAEQVKNSQQNHYEKTIDLLIPRSVKEKKYFFLVSLTAGICEEIVWRGAMLFLLKDIFPAMHIVGCVLIASAMFGLCHFYQGINGVIKTEIAGFFFMILYLVTDSVLLGIILHFMFDVSSAFLLTEEYDDKREVQKWMGN